VSRPTGRIAAPVAVAAAALLVLDSHALVAETPRSAALLADRSAGRDWAGYGRTNGQQHFSPLTQVDRGSVRRLGLTWSIDLLPENSVTQPIAVDGVLYFATGLSVVHAVDGVTGRELWRYDPGVGAVGGLNMRTAWGVRGVGWWNGKVFVATQDGRLIALEARNGKPAWSVQTTRPEDPEHVNGAPRVFNGRVLIGSAGTTGPMRGHVSCYDAESGKLLWRFWTVPGDPAKGFENDAMAMAAKTWSGEWWKFGGGGMVWNSMAFDAETDTVFIGTGSPYPWNHRIRSQGQGDNLFVSSIVALEGRTGAYKWHFQPTPGDTWDFDATMDIELADLVIGGRLRKVLLQAPKNGFFYVIDRVTGRFISAEPYVPVTWASRVDPATGRPVEVLGARYSRGKPARITPTSLGGHNWMSMAYSPQTGLAYIPANHFAAIYADIERAWRAPADRSVDGGVDIAGGPAAGLKPATGSLIAWSPAEQKAIWRVPYPTHLNGGVLATAGGLVFQGSLDGKFRAFAADTGKLVWKFDAKAPILATPIAFEAGGREYVTVLTGSGMGISMFAPSMAGDAIERYGIDPLSQARRVLTFALSGTRRLPKRGHPAPAPDDTGFRRDADSSARGYIAYQTHCLNCHGDRAIGIGNGPDLRRSATIQDHATFERIVRGGALETQGMPRFEELGEAELDDIRHYLRDRAATLRASSAR
jgi:quinohemoprotein ethanol dehydrogenase